MVGLHFNRKAPYLIGTPMVSCRSSNHSIRLPACQGIPGMGGGFAKQGPPWRKTTEKVFNEAPGNCFGILWVMFPGVYNDCLWSFIAIFFNTELFGDVIDLFGRNWFIIPWSGGSKEAMKIHIIWQIRRRGATKLPNHMIAMGIWWVYHDCVVFLWEFLGI